MLAEMQDDAVGGARDSAQVAAGIDRDTSDSKKQSDKELPSDSDRQSRERQSRAKVPVSYLPLGRRRSSASCEVTHIPAPPSVKVKRSSSGSDAARGAVVQRRYSDSRLARPAAPRTVTEPASAAQQSSSDAPVAKPKSTTPKLRQMSASPRAKRSPEVHSTTYGYTVDSERQLRGRPRGGAARSSSASSAAASGNSVRQRGGEL